MPRRLSELGICHTSPANNLISETHGRVEGENLRHKGDLWPLTCCGMCTSHIIYKYIYTQTHIAMQIHKLGMDSEHKNGFLVGWLTYGPAPKWIAQVQNGHPSLWYVVQEVRWTCHHGVWWLGLCYALSGIIDNFYVEHRKFVTTGKRERGKVEKSMPPWNLPSSKSRGFITFITAQRLAPKNSIPRKPDRLCLPCPLLARLWSSHVNHSYRHAHVQGRGTASTFN